MSYASVMVHLDRSERAMHRLDLAAQYAQAHGAKRGPLVFSAITGGTQTQHWRGGGVGRSLILLAFLFTSQTGIVASH